MAVPSPCLATWFLVHCGKSTHFELVTHKLDFIDVMLLLIFVQLLQYRSRFGLNLNC